MRHVDDGILHAYLDGALEAVAHAGELPNGVTPVDVREHLESCPDCSARLTQARAVKERAGAVLQDAGTVDVDAPPFRALDDRPGTEHVGAGPKPVRRTWLPLTWAATVLLALGAGWWGSVLWRAEPQRMSDASAIEATSTAQQSGAVEPTIGTKDDAAQEETAEQSARPAPVRSAPSPLADADAGAAASADADGGADAAAQALPRTGAADERVAATGADERQSRTGGAATAPAAAPPPPPVSEAQEARLEPAWDFLDQLATARADSAAWTVLDTDATDTLSAVIVQGAGAPTFASAPPVIGTGPLVRVRQQLTGGKAVELVFAQPGIVSSSAFEPAVPAMGLSAARSGAAGSGPTKAAATGAAAASEAGPTASEVDVVSSRQHEDGTSEIVVRMPDTGAYVVLRGAMTPDELARLAARLVRR